MMYDAHVLCHICVKHMLCCILYMHIIFYILYYIICYILYIIYIIVYIFFKPISSSVKTVLYFFVNNGTYQFFWVKSSKKKKCTESVFGTLLAVKNVDPKREPPWGFHN